MESSVAIQIDQPSNQAKRSQRCPPPAFLITSDFPLAVAIMPAKLKKTNEGTHHETAKRPEVKARSGR